MKLYMHPVSMTSRPVRLFMAEKGLKADEEVIDLMTGAHFQEPYASLNPNKLVPMLEDDGFKLTESSAILKYLADKFDLPEYPKDLKQRARVNEIMDWLNTNFYREWAYGLCYPQLFPHHEAAQTTTSQKATVEWGKEQSKRWLQVLNDHWIGPNNQYLTGNTITIADYFGAGLVTLGELIRCDMTRLSEHRALARQHEEAQELAAGERGLRRLQAALEGSAVRARCSSALTRPAAELSVPLPRVLMATRARARAQIHEGGHAQHRPADRLDPASDRRDSELAAQPQLGLRPSGILGVVLVVVLMLALTGRV